MTLGVWRGIHWSRSEANGVGAGVGGILGGLLGGFKSVLVGADIGAGGAIAATESKGIVLPASTNVRVRFDSAAEVRRS